MEPADARRVLGVGPDADSRTLRAAYRRALRTTHPDRSSHPDATARTVRLTEAYRVLSHASAVPEPSPAGPAAPQARSGGDVAPTGEPVSVWMVDAETIGVDVPADEAMLLLLDAADRLGDIAYLDRSAGLIEVVVEFVGAPTSSVVLTTQGRATGVTEVFCSVEPLSGGEAPPCDAVARLLHDMLSVPSVTSSGPGDSDTRPPHAGGAP